MKYWSISALSEETGLDRRTIKKRLALVKPADTTPAGDPLYAGQVAFPALFGVEHKPQNIAESEARKKEAEASLAELQLARERNQVVEVESVLRVWQNIAIAIRQVIKHSSLSDVEKQECLRQIRELNVD